MRDNPRAAITFYWRETLQQVNVHGVVEVENDALADALFNERPYEARVTTAISRQGEELTPAIDLCAIAASWVTAGRPVKRPADWLAYRLVPTFVEFWHGSTDRLHRRLVYTVDADGRWSNKRLQA